MTGPEGDRFQRSTEALSRRVGTDVLVTTPGDDQVYELSGGATAVWDELGAPKTRPELVDRLAAAHDVATDAIADQIATCLEELLSVGAVVEVRGTDA